jgi:hypothetical protein
MASGGKRPGAGRKRKHLSEDARIAAQRKSKREWNARNPEVVVRSRKEWERRNPEKARQRDLDANRRRQAKKEAAYNELVIANWQSSKAE